MELSQGFPVILITRGCQLVVRAPKRDCDSHPVDDIAERLEGIPVMHVDG